MAEVFCFPPDRMFQASHSDYNWKWCLFILLDWLGSNLGVPFQACPIFPSRIYILFHVTYLLWHSSHALVRLGLLSSYSGKLYLLVVQTNTFFNSSFWEGHRNTTLDFGTSSEILEVSLEHLLLKRKIQLKWMNKCMNAKYMVDFAVLTFYFSFALLKSLLMVFNSFRNCKIKQHWLKVKLCLVVFSVCQIFFI